jgi:hypothetical protein
MKDKSGICATRERTRLTTLFTVILGMTFTIMLAGCTATRMEAMVPEMSPPAKQFPYSVIVGHEGTSIRSPNSLDPDAAKFFGSSSATHVNADTFMRSVVESITNSKMFQHVKKTGPTDFRLDTNIISEIQPGPGLQMSSTIVVAWKLTRLNDRQVVFDELIETTHRALPGSVVGIRTAVEGAVRDNIQEGINRLSKLDL